MEIIFETKYFNVIANKLPLHITREDWWHLRITPKVPCEDRTELSIKQAQELSVLIMLIWEAMQTAMSKQWINIKRINYQSNWNYNHTFHVHIYGRAEDAKIQPYGNALNFPKINTWFYDKNQEFTDKDLIEIKKKINKLLKTEKYQNIFE